MTHEVIFAPEAQADLLDLYDAIAKDGGDARALAYVERIQAACLRLRTFSRTGHPIRQYPARDASYRL